MSILIEKLSILIGDAGYDGSYENEFPALDTGLFLISSNRLQKFIGMNFYFTPMN